MGMVQRDPYFDTMPERQPLVWASAVRRQLERWEPLVARHVLAGLQKHQSPSPEQPISFGLFEMWQGESEHHFLLVAAGQLLKGLGMLDAPPKIGEVVASELREARDLNEHWEDNMPVFNVGPARPKEPPRPSGKRFADRNPRHGPYCWWAWDGIRGPMVTPNVTATQVHELVELAITACNAERPGVPVVIPGAAPRPWYIPTTDAAEWWPKLDEVSL
jgi:hypothetical protein